MTRSIALNLLSKGNNGIELLKILDVIATEEAEQSSWTPIDVIEFWWYNLLSGTAVIRAAVIRVGSYGCLGGYRGGARIIKIQTSLPYRGDNSTFKYKDSKKFPEVWRDDKVLTDLRILVILVDIHGIRGARMFLWYVPIVEAMRLELISQVL